MQAQPKFTNKLINETSPYLLQHAHNPVDWYAWGDEAFAKAKAEDKPVLVSIGYSACHWCHVMEHESFEDEATAAIMNENFVNIKVDMEERPDVDQIYMNFVQMTTGRGGWPMNVFLTPDKLPFFGGTYFPPTPRFNMPAFSQILSSVATAYREKRSELLDSASDILGEMKRLGNAEFSPGSITIEQLDSAFGAIARSFDGVNGGFGGAPKFPPSMALDFLLRYHDRTGDKLALEIVSATCKKMGDGGICDQIGGGFHRYSVDEKWLVPHFEKMLYDNAQLIRLYLHMYQITGEDRYRAVAVNTLEYVKREMLDASGGFYSSQDADSEGVEGKFFVWTPDEIKKILGESDAEVFNFYYDISEEGNFEGSNIPNVRYSTAEAAEALGIDEDVLEAALSRGRDLLFREREKRVKPARDEKILTAWNGLMLAAFAEAAAVLESDEYLRIAMENANFILSELREGNRLLRTWKGGKAKLNGYLEDYANLIDGLIELYQASARIDYLVAAKDLADVILAEFWDNENGGFFFTSNDHEELIVRNKDFYDNATPSGNSAAADVLLKLSKFFGDERYERFAVTVLRMISPQIRRYPSGFGRALSAMEFHLGTTAEIVIVGPAKGNELAQAVRRDYLPNKVLLVSEDPKGDAGVTPLFESRQATNELPTAYVCRDFVCKKPVTTVDELRKELASE